MSKRKTTLIAEGGGQLGIFTAGVLDCFSRHNYDDFDAFIGVSAGTHNLTSYLCGPVGYGKKVIEELTTDKTFLSFSRLFSGGHLMDLDWYYTMVESHPEFKLNLDSVPSRLGDREITFCATNWNDGSPRYMAPNRKNWLEYSKASSAIPFIYRKGVTIAEECLVDGGLSDPLPVLKAYEDGATDIVVIRTVPADSRYSFEWMRQFNKFLNTDRPWYKQLIRIHEAYEQALDFIKTPPEGVRITQICPSTPLASRVLFSRKETIRNDYYQGCTEGTQYLRSIGHIKTNRQVKRHDTLCLSGLNLVSKGFNLPHRFFTNALE